MDQRRKGLVIVAAGRGERAGAADGPKQYRRLGRQSVLSHALDCFAEELFAEVVVVIHPDDTELFRHHAAGSAARPILGGRTRQESVLRGLEALEDAALDVVLIHDAARPFAQPLVGPVLAAVDAQAGAIPALPVSDTLKRATPDGFIETTVRRNGLYGAQTPQGFPFRPILKAHRDAAQSDRDDFTDDASIAEWAGLPVRLVAGLAGNVKITYAADLDQARLRMKETDPMLDVRVGNGYDVHRLVPGDHVTLCGVRIAHDMTLSGHSDADVCLHALTDALLATCGAGDIGDHFPPSDPQWKGAASRIFLTHAAGVVRKAGGRIANVDISLICEAPKIAPHRDAMRQAIGDMLALPLDRVSVKATTNETIGFVGRKEGIAAIATASVIFGEASYAG